MHSSENALGAESGDLLIRSVTALFALEAQTVQLGDNCLESASGRAHQRREQRLGSPRVVDKGKLHWIPYLLQATTPHWPSTFFSIICNIMRSRSVEMHNPGSSVVPPSDSSSSSESSDDEGVAEEMPQAAIDESSALQEEQDPYRWRKFFVRSLALLCAMALSIGSHL